MTDLPEEIETTDDGNLATVCSRVCTSLHPSGNREADEKYLLENICRIMSERTRRSVPVASYPAASNTHDLRERLMRLVTSSEELSALNDCIEEFLDNVYPKS